MRGAGESSSPGGALLSVLGGVVLAALLAIPLAAQEEGPPERDRIAPAAEQEGEPGEAGRRELLGTYAVLAYDRDSGQLGMVAASGGFSVASGTPHLEHEAGAVAVLGRTAARPGRRALEALRGGVSPADALSAAWETQEDPSSLVMAALTRTCERDALVGQNAYRWSGQLSGQTGAICYVAVGSLLPDERVLSHSVTALRRAGGDLLDRLTAALEAAEEAAGEPARSRSVALWIDAPDVDRGVLGRASLRLQVEAAQRPAAAMARLMRTGRADHLARQASFHADEGEFERAVELADRALELDPTSSLAWFTRGRALLFMERDRDAETAFRRMLEVNPYLFHVLGGPQEMVGDEEPAVERLIPFRPRLLQRLDVYRRAFFPDVEFPEEEVSPEAVDPGESDGATGPGSSTVGGDGA